MKRFLLFSGPQYYPGGGWDDFIDSFDSLEEAQQYIADKCSEWGQWSHIIDTSTWEKIG